MRIAVLYLMTGIGHFREALAVSSALKNKNYLVDVIDLERQASTSVNGKFLVIF